MRLQDDAEVPVQINIVPMIDVIFAILTFFIMSTLFLTRSAGLSVDLPQAASAQAQRPAQITVTINEKGDIFLDRQPVAVENLGNAVKQALPTQGESLVVLNADKSVRHGLVVEVMDRLRQIKGVKLAIAAQKL